MVVRGMCEWRVVRFHLSFTVLTEEDDVPGSKFERESEEYTVGQLKRWLKCRRLKLSGKRDELLKRVSDCIKSGNHHTLDPSIDDGKWFLAKVLKENAKLQANCSLSSLPFVPSTGWRTFPSQNIPSLFNYGHVACVAGVRRGRKEERRAREAREDRTREDRGRGRLQGRYCFLYFAL